MTIPLARLKEFELTRPEPGSIALAIARHQAATWPSPEVTAYAQQRAHLVHKLVDETGVSFVSMGELDSPYPREVVQVILAIAPGLIAAVGTVLAAWLSRPSKRKTYDDVKVPLEAPTQLPGIAIRRPNGDVLTITYRDDLSEEVIRDTISTFLLPNGLD